MVKSNPAFKALGKLITEVHGNLLIDGNEIDISDEVITIRKELQSLLIHLAEVEQDVAGWRSAAEAKLNVASHPDVKALVEAVNKHSRARNVACLLDTDDPDFYKAWEAESETHADLLIAISALQPQRESEE